MAAKNDLLVKIDPDINLTKREYVIQKKIKKSFHKLPCFSSTESYLPILITGGEF